jgi:imidazolonepropionase-like amidohydrolase
LAVQYLGKRAKTPISLYCARGFAQMDRSISQMKYNDRPTNFIVLAVFAALALVCPGIAAQSASRPIVLKGALLIDGTGRPAVENSVVVITGDKVVAAGKAGAVKIPKDADVRDMSGKTIMPSLINLHGHLGLSTNGFDSTGGKYTEENVRHQLQQYQSYGVGTIASLGEDSELIFTLRDAQHAGNLPGARLFTAGRGFAEANAHPNPADARYHPLTAEEARADIDTLAVHHPDYVKMWVDDNLGHGKKMTPEVYKAIIDQAHSHNIRVFAHMFYLADAKALIAAGIDGFAHSVRDQPVDPELIKLMKARDMFLIPTLVRDEVLFAYTEPSYWVSDPFFQAGVNSEIVATLRSPDFVNKIRKDPDLQKYKDGLAMAEKNLKTLSDGGVKIAFGTDSGIPTRFPGYFEHRELQLMVEAGLTPMQAIVAATGTNAAILKGEKQFGTLQPGRQADLLILDASPLQDIHNTEKLSAVWQAGKPVPSFSATKN